jgi:hypothetical protein
MSRSPREPRPPGWTIHSISVPRRDAPRRLERAFQVLLEADPGVDHIPSTNEEDLAHASRRLCQGLDPEAGA